MFLGDIPASELWKQIIDTREALAALRNSVGIPDSFTVPAGLVRTSDGPDGGSTGNVLASMITCEVLGRQFTSIHNVKRADWNAALNAMNVEIQKLKSPTGTSTSVAPAVPTITTGDQTATPQTTVPNVSSALPSVLSGNTLLYVFAGGAVLYFLTQKKGGNHLKRMRTRRVRVVRKRTRKARR